MKFGISVSKKLGNAIVRNKYKRIIKYIVKDYIKLTTELPAKINLIPKRLIIRYNFFFICKDLFWSLDKLI